MAGKKKQSPSNKVDKKVLPIDSYTAALRNHPKGHK